jgi:radical SAM superfamily enzyme YgiQ (UPF0313 family)
MNLVLVSIHIEPSSRAVPLGPALLSSVLRRSFGDQVRTRLLDLFVGEPAADCAERILESDPGYVGFSMYVWNRGLALEIASVLRAKRPGLVLFAGGAEATADPPGVLAHPAIDFVLPGEAEDSIVEAVRRLLDGATPREIALSAKSSPVKDLGSLPSPYLDGTLRPRDYGGALWELSRGCPFSCSFCAEGRGSAGIRRFPLERMEAELELFAASGISEVFVLDPTFNYHRENAKQVLRLIAAKAPEIHYSFEIRSEFLDEEMTGLFAALRCSLQIGLESSNDEALRNIGRTFDPEDFEAKTLLLHEAGVPYGFDLIYGLPGDSLEGFRASLDFAMALVPNHVDLFRLSVLPGTRLSETAAGLKLEHEASHPYFAIASPTFGREEMEQAARIAHSCDVLYNRGRAVPWFGIVVDALEMLPSEVFRRFAAWLDEHVVEDLTRTQREFIGSLFEEAGNSRMGGVATDVIGYFGYSAELTASAPGESDREPPASRRVSFNHDPVDLLGQLEAGTTSLEELVFSLPEKACEAVISIDRGAIDVEVLRVS